MWQVIRIITEPTIQTLYWHRLAHFLYNKNLRRLSFLVRNINRFLTGIEIHPHAKLGQRVSIRHGMGTVIGFGAVIEDDVTIFHQVTVGSKDPFDLAGGYPTIRRGSVLYAGAKVLGPITLGEYSVVGANSVIMKDVPPYAVVAGIPARIVGENQAAATKDGRHQDE